MRSATTDVNTLVDHLFRRKAGQMISTLTRIFGSHNIDLAEAVVQEALIKAIKVWSVDGIPQNPSAWIIQVAKNKALDSLRRERLSEEKYQLLAEQVESSISPSWFDTDETLREEFKDDLLTMLFICCHPTISEESQVALALKTIFGFGVNEIAKAFLSKPKTIEQRITRAKRTIRKNSLAFELPDRADLEARLGPVLATLYFIFNEGYVAYEGHQLIRQELCAEALRLTQLLIRHKIGQFPKVYALMALLLFQSSRLEARLEMPDSVHLLKDQDRTKWDRNLIKQGLKHLSLAAAGNELSTYHIEAGIAACHATAKSFEETDWTSIVSYYNDLILINSSPVIQLNRAVAIFYKDGVEQAQIAMVPLAQHGEMQRYYLYHATLGEFLKEQKKFQLARASFQRAIALVKNRPEKVFLEKKLALLANE